MLRSIKWNTPGFSDYELFRHHTPGDMHCFFHSVAFAIYKPYRKCVIDGRPGTRKEIALEFRRGLIDRLSRIDPVTRKRLYDTIGNGNLAQLGRADPEYYSLSAIKKMLLGDVFVGHEIIVVMEKVLQMNIYVIRGDSKDVSSGSGEDNYDRSIVLYYDNNHYETVSRRLRDDRLITHFKKDDSFIEMLRTRIKNASSNKQ